MPGPAKNFDRDAALDQAIDLFWREGYGGTSVQDLLDAMGISRSSMYSTFGDKRALFLESLRTWIDEGIAQFADDLHGDESFVVRLSRAMQSKQAWSAEHGNAGCFFGNEVAELAGQDPEIDRVLSSFERRVSRLIRRALIGAIEQNELHADTDVDALSDFILVVGQGASLLSKRRPTLLGELGPTLLRVIQSDAFRRV